jgi:hypothetical protein
MYQPWFGWFFECGVPLKKVGDVVKTGESAALTYGAIYREYLCNA